MFSFEAASNVTGVAHRAITFRIKTAFSGRGCGHIFDGIETIDVLNDARDFICAIAEMFQRWSNRLVNDF